MLSRHMLLFALILASPSFAEEALTSVSGRVMWTRDGCDGWTSKGYALATGPGMNKR